MVQDVALSRPKHGFESRWEHHRPPRSGSRTSRCGGTRTEVALPFALAFIDCEFGGLDPDRHDITEIAVILTDERLVEQSAKAWKVRARPERITAEAAAISGWNAEGWSDAVPLSRALAELGALLPAGHTVLPAGQNVRMDVQFLERGFRRCGLHWPFDYHVIDLVTLFYAWSLLSGELPGTLSLRQAATVAGLIDGAVPHRALEDARLSLDAFRHFLGRLAPREREPRETLR